MELERIREHLFNVQNNVPVSMEDLEIMENIVNCEKQDCEGEESNYLDKPSNSICDVS